MAPFVNPKDAVAANRGMSPSDLCSFAVTAPALSADVSTRRVV